MCRFVWFTYVTCAAFFMAGVAWGTTAFLIMNGLTNFLDELLNI